MIFRRGLQFHSLFVANTRFLLDTVFTISSHVEWKPTTPIQAAMHRPLIPQVPSIRLMEQRLQKQTAMQQPNRHNQRRLL